MPPIEFKDAMTLTQEQLAELSELHGKLHRTELCGTGYLFRRAYKPDWDILEKYQSANPNATREELEERLVDICLIGPKPSPLTGGWSNVEAGILPTLALLIKAKSGFIVPEFADSQLLDTVDISDPVTPATPSDEELAALKSTNKFQLKGVLMEELYVVVRPLTRIEWKTIQKSATEDADRILCEKAVLWPTNINWDTDYPVGYADTISQVVLSISGFTRPQSVEDI